MNTDALTICVDNTTIKTMLLRHSRDMIKPPAPYDTASASLIHDGIFWLVFRFFHPGDEGYAAYGIPESSTKEQREEFCRACFETIQEASECPEMPMGYVEVDPVEGN